MTQNKQAPIRLAIIGAGIFAREAHASSLGRLPHLFEIVAVYSRTEASAKAFAAQLPGSVEWTTDLSALLAREDIEAVDIVLPIDVMAPVVAQALRSGKHVLSEKPIAPDVATGKQLLAPYDAASGQVWMVGENWRYEGAYPYVAALIQAGKIGRPVTCQWPHYIRMDETSKYYGTAWRRSGSFPGGFLLDGGVHHVAVLRAALGEISEVSAIYTQVSPALLPVDTMSVAMRFANGTVGTYIVSYAVSAPWPSTLQIIGDKGAMSIERQAITVHVNEPVKDDFVKAHPVDGVQRTEYIFHNGVEDELADFASAIRHGTVHRNRPEEALKDVAVVEAMLRSAESGERVSCEL